MSAQRDRDNRLNAVLNIAALEADMKQRLAWAETMNEKLRDDMRLDEEQMNTPFLPIRINHEPN